MVKIAVIPDKVQNKANCTKIGIFAGETVVVGCFNRDAKSITVSGFGRAFAGRKFKLRNFGIPAVIYEGGEFFCPETVRENLLTCMQGILRHKYFGTACRAEADDIRGTVNAFLEKLTSAPAPSAPEAATAPSAPEAQEIAPAPSAPQIFVLRDDSGLSEFAAGNFYNILQILDDGYVIVANDNGEARTLKKNRGKMI